MTALAFKTSRLLEFENQPKTDDPVSRSPSEPESGDFQIERPDWVLFRSLGTLGQKAGVPLAKLRRLCLKELTDNSLDAGARVTIREPTLGRYVIDDDGPGLDGSPEDIARLFSIDRPLVSSKLFRKPQRGALGNGLRVVAGAVIASGGKLVVTTRNQRLTITPLATGGASVIAEPAAYPTGTKIEVSFGSDMPKDTYALLWACKAIRMAEGGPTYSGATSAHWFDADSFYELVHGADGRPVRALVEKLDGCSGAKASEVAAPFLQRSCGSLTRDETTQLLRRAREMTAPVSGARLGAVGKLDGLPHHYARKHCTIELGITPKAHIPFVVEAWVDSAEDAESTIAVYINRTPVSDRRRHRDEARNDRGGAAAREGWNHLRFARGDGRGPLRTAGRGTGQARDHSARGRRGSDPHRPHRGARRR